MNFVIKSFVGAGEVEFGMTANQVRSLIDENFTSFKRSPNSQFPCDHFESIGMFVYYKSPGIVEAIEFSAPGEPQFENTDLLKISFDSLKKILASHDASLEIESDSLTSYRLGVGAYAPYAEENSSLPAASIIVFEKGYYS